MADLTKRIIFIILYWLFETKLISAYYCYWGACTPDEECCGNHKCCPKAPKLNANDVEYVLIWILGGIMIAIMCIGLYKYKSQLRRLLCNQSADKIPFAA